MKWFGRFFRFVQADALVMLAALMNRRTPLKVKGIAALAVLYLFIPIDILPDMVPLAGLLDDVIVIPAILGTALNLLPPGIRADSEAQAIRMKKQAPLILAAISAVLPVWMIMVLWALYSLVKYLIF